jgi:cytochrome d ubiquinol oxidase subunit II
MTYVALGIPFVLAYIAYLWKKMDSQKLSIEDTTDHEAY